MDYKYQYETQADREALIVEHADKILVEEQNLFEGNFLIFSDTPRPVVPVSKPVTSEELIAIQDQNLVIMDAIATLYEDIVLGGGAIG